MDFDVDTLGPCRKKVKITVPKARVLEEYDRQYDEINDSLALPGFRKGRAPRRILEKRFGTHLADEVKQKLVEAAMKRLVEEIEVEPLRAPDLDLESLEVGPEAAFEFEFELVTKPEFETPEYDGLEVEVPPIVVADEDVDNAVEELRRSKAVLKTPEDAQVEDDDILVVDWEAKDGDSVEAHDENAYYPYGRGVISGFVADGLDEQLAAKKPGATATAKARVNADDSREELRDREFDFSVELKEIKRFVLPELDEAFLKQEDYDDVEEMRDDLSKRIKRHHQRQIEQLAEEKIVKQLAEGVEMDLPEDFIEDELEQWAQSRRMRLQVEGVADDEIEKKLDQERVDAKTEVQNQLRRVFLLDRIAGAEEVKVAEADLLQAIQNIARYSGRPEEEVASNFRDPAQFAELNRQVLHQKVREALRLKAKLVEKEVPADEDAPDAEE